MTEIETKGVQVLTADIKAQKADDGSYDITLSVPTQDRDGEVVDAGALKWLASGRMPIDVDHGMTVLTTVGSGIPVYDGDLLKLEDFRFASTPFAQDVKTLVDEGHVSKMSVAFLTAKREKDEKDGLVHVREAELLNAAIVAIPSNREADILVGKALASLAERLPNSAKVGARNSAKDAEMIQSVHDAAASLGAACDGLTKSLVLTDEVEGAIEAVVGPPEETAPAPCPTCGQIPAATDPEEPAAADEAAAEDPPADVLLAQAQASIAAAELTLLP
jgi:HK97 family phage prohead protease